ncbi:hypothetical protein CPC08DRAFT_728584 [Agrocybe pediades]|nr:hypothetical protein CPC08DRAFT_728584 [Agrocybe pediades]
MHLNDDILLLVFETLATERNVDIGRRQAAIRYASHVCQRWRDLILSASYIWGRLVWVNRLQKPPWMREVFQRAKTASLFSVTLDGKRGGCRDSWMQEKDRPFNGLAITVLQNAWSRLEEVYISYWTDLYRRSGRDFHDYLWEQIRNPSPSLRSIVIHDWSEFMTKPLPVDSFNGSAPLLRELSCIPARLPGPNPWLSRITTLEFTPRSLEDIINAVSWAHDLKILRLGEYPHEHIFFRSEDYSKLELMSPIILPRLARIAGLGCISIHETHITEGQDPGPSQFLTALFNFFYHHSGITTSNIHRYDWRWVVQADNTLLVIEARARSESHSELYMKLSFYCGHEGNYRIIMPFIARAIAEYARCTKYFQLNFVGNMIGYIEERLFGSLLFSLTDVKSITVGYSPLGYYDELEDREGREMFTKLRTVYFELHSGMYDRTLRQAKAFLVRRVKSGRPVSTVHFQSNLSSEDKSKILRALEDVRGLRIMWGTQ